MLKQGAVDKEQIQSVFPEQPKVTQWARIMLKQGTANKEQIQSYPVHVLRTARGHHGSGTC